MSLAALVQAQETGWIFTARGKAVLGFRNSYKKFSFLTYLYTS